MGPRANSLRNTPVKAVSAFADKSARAAGEQAVRVVALDLKPLIAPYRERGRLTIRLENLPQSARLSAGQNNGDRTWSLAQDELEDLSYFPPPGQDEEHALTVRLIAKDETGASTVALLEARVGGAMADTTPPFRLARKSGQSETVPDDSLLQMVAQLKAALAAQESELAKLQASAGQDRDLRPELDRLKTVLAARESELGPLRAALEQAGTQSQEKIDAALWAAESIWKRDEAARLNALRAQLQAQIEKQAETERRTDSRARAAQERDAAALDKMQEELARAQQLLAGQDGELKRLLADVERSRRERDAEMASVRETAAGQAASAAQRQTQTDAALADLTARWEAAQAALAATQASGEQTLQQQQAELEQLRQECQSLAAARAATENMAAEKLKAAQSQWEQQTARALTDIATRCEVAEVALAAARAANADDKSDAEATQLQAELDRLRREMATARTGAETTMAERLKAAQAQWEEQTAKALSEILVRAETAEQALATVRAAVPAGNADAELVRLRSDMEAARRQVQEFAAAKAQAERTASETLKNAQAQWQHQTNQALAEVTARAQAAEAAFAGTRTNQTNQSESDAYIRSLNREIKTLQAALVDREAALGRAQASLEQQRFGSEGRGPVGQWRPLPGGSYPREGRDGDGEANSHLMRDVVILFLIVLVGVLAFPHVESMLPDDVRWQIETGGGLFAPASSTSTGAPATTPAAHVTPKTEHLATVSRGVNLRDQPSVNGALVANLKRGAAVTILEMRGNWDRVSTADAGQKPLQGWVYNSYVEDGAAKN